MNNSKCLKYAGLIGGVFTLLLILLYRNVFPRDCITDFTTNFLDMKIFSSTSSFEEQKAEDNLDLDHSEGKKDVTSVGYSNTVEQRIRFQSNTIQTGLWTPLPGQKNVPAIENLKPVNFNLSYDVASGSEITPCNKIDKPLVVYRFTGNVLTSITTLRT